MRYCEVCGSKKQDSIFNDVVVCKNCDFAYDYVCTQEERTKYYKKMEKKSYYLANLPVSPLYLKQQQSTAEFVKKYICGRKPLDVGCFTGQLMKLIGGDIEGIDPSPTAIEFARKDKLKVMCGDIFTHRFKRKYDAIILSHVLEHIVDLRKFVIILSELLNKDGVIIIETPDASLFCLEKSKEFINDQREPLLQFSYEHVNYFTTNSLTNLFSNFDCVASWSVCTTVYALRMVFKKRHDSSIRPSLKNHVNESLAEFERINKKIKTITGPVYVWGLGAYTKKLLLFADLTELQIRAFIDNTYKGKEYFNVPVIREPVEDIPIVIGSMQYEDYVKKLYKGRKLITL